MTFAPILLSQYAIHEPLKPVLPVSRTVLFVYIPPNKFTILSMAPCHLPTTLPIQSYRAWHPCISKNLCVCMRPIVYRWQCLSMVFSPIAHRPYLFRGI